MSIGPETRLAVYGSLAPGKPNAHILAPLGGTWRGGTVRGRLVQSGWGAAMGFPGIVLDPGADTVVVQLLESGKLPSHWDELDAFEGAGYRRAPVQVATPEGAVAAFIYVLAEQPAPP